MMNQTLTLQLRGFTAVRKNVKKSRKIETKTGKSGKSQGTLICAALCSYCPLEY